ncbi:hypothetical protein [Coraliomargarita sinensis]|nr:hypothetical protein [Coraliomargarita sinensis]
MEDANQRTSQENSRNAKNAELQLGPNHGTWYSRGYLPHFDRIGNLQSITFRMADRLPQSKLSQLEAIIKALPKQADPDKSKREQVEAWLDAGMGSCALKHPPESRESKAMRQTGAMALLQRQPTSPGTPSSGSAAR